MLLAAYPPTVPPRFLALVSLIALVGCVAPDAGAPPVTQCNVDLDAPVWTDASGGVDLPEPPGPSCTSVVWAGDILLADAALPTLQAEGYDHPFEHVQHLLDAGDVVIGNAEGPITEIEEAWNSGQQWNYNALPEAAQALADAGFDALSLANNHLNDRGPEGIADTLGHLDDVGVAAFGGGMDLSEARAPFVFASPMGLVAVFGFGKPSNWVDPATPTQPGQLLLNATNANAAISVAEELGVAYTVAFPHWGANYSDVSNTQRNQARILIDAGFDLIVGHGPHNEQGDVEEIDGVPVLWSLGNFTFGTPGRFDDEFPGVGLVATTTFGAGGLEGIELACIVTDNSVVAFQPWECE